MDFIVVSQFPLSRPFHIITELKTVKIINPKLFKLKHFLCVNFKPTVIATLLSVVAQLCPKHFQELLSDSVISCIFNTYALA